MKKITLFLFALFTCWQINAQVSSYDFSQFIGTYTENSAGATTIPGVRADSFISTAQNIGFNFVYDGITYTQFKMSSNGFISLNMSGTSSLTANDLSAANATSRPIIAPLWDDLDGATPTTSVASYEVTGTAPNRVLTVEWRNWEWNWNSGATPVISFQTKLYETTNVIEFVYRQETGAVLSGSASIGIGSATGSGAGSYLSLSDVATPAVSSTTSTNTLNTKPATGQVYRFTPPSCSSPSGFAVSNLTTTSATISWNAAVPVPSTGYEYYYSNVNTPPAGAGTPTTALTDNLSGLTPNTTYYVWLRSDCGGGTLSTWAGPFSFKTLCNALTTLPHAESFDAATNPSCWSTALVSGATNWAPDDSSDGVPAARTGARFAGKSWASGDDDALLISPMYNLAAYATDQARLNVWIYRSASGLATDKITFYANTVNNLTGATMLVDVPLPISAAPVVASAGWYNYIVDLPLSFNTGGNFYIIAQGRTSSSFSSYSVGFDDYVLELIPSCIEPNTLAASNVTNNSVDLSWVDPSGVQFDFEYAIQPQGTGTPVGSGTQISDVTVPGEMFDVNGNPLTANTAYEFYVRADCGGTFSTWAGPITFRTLCETVTSFVQNFDGITTPAFPSCWSKVGATGAANTQTGSPNSTPNTLYMYSSSTSNLAVVAMQPVSNLGAGTHRLRMNMRANFTTNGVIEFGYLTDPNNAASFVLISSVTAATTTYQQYVITPPAGSYSNFPAFRHTGSPANSILIDDVVWEQIPVTPPTCATNVVATPHPTCGNYANSITWDVTSGADGYYVTIGTTSGGNIIANAIPVSGTSYNFTGNFNTTYFYTIVPFNAIGSATGCTEQSFTTNASGCYCVSAPTSVDGTGITNVQLVATNFANTVSTSPVYNDHTATVVDMSQGISNSVQITFNTDSFGTSYDYNTVIWIDVNDNFTFEPSEIVFTGVSAAVSPTILNASFVMPGTAPLGQHRMRIVATDALQTPANPCYSGAYGETADFTVNIVAASCTPPAATTTVVPACGTAQYSIDVNVTALGSGTPSITDGTTTWPVSAIGVVNVGPFASGSSVTLTLLHGSDATCNLPLGNFVYNCPPTNDDCANAVSLTVNPDFSCSTVTAGTTQAATDSGIEPTFTVSGTPDNDVWYSFVATGTAHRISLLNIVAVTGFSTDMGIAVFDGTGTCSALTLVGSSDPETYNLTGLTPGTTYYVAVYGWGAAPGAVANFNICVGTPPAPPANDECANAIAISSMPYSNTQDASAATGPVVSTCTGMNDGVWYTVVGNGADIIIDVTAVTGWDPELGIYTGSCGTFTCVDSIDDEGTSVGETYTIVASTLGTTYYINVGHYSGFGDSPEGPFTIDVTTTLSSDSFDNANFTAYPNPVKDVLNVSYTSEISSIRVINMIGQEVISKNINATSTQVDMSQLSAGTYIVNVTVGDNVKTLKVVKQ